MLFQKNNASNTKYHMPFHTESEKCAEEEYMEIVDNYIRYYCQRADTCKYEYYTLNIVRLIAMGIVPVLEVINGEFALQWIVVAASSVAILMEGLISLWKVRKKWLLYRDTYNKLIREQRQYVIISKIMDGRLDEKKKAFEEFVERVESIIQNEGDKWQETVNKDSKTDEEEGKRNDS